MQLSKILSITTLISGVIFNVTAAQATDEDVLGLSSLGSSSLATATGAAQLPSASITLQQSTGTVRHAPLRYLGLWCSWYNTASPAAMGFQYSITVDNVYVEGRTMSFYPGNLTFQQVAAINCSTVAQYACANYGYGVSAYSFASLPDTAIRFYGPIGVQSPMSNSVLPLPSYNYSSGNYTCDQV